MKIKILVIMGFLLLLSFSIVSSTSNNQSHPISEIDEINVTIEGSSHNASLNSSYHFHVENITAGDYLFGNGSFLFDVNASTWADNFYNASRYGILQRISGILSPVTSLDKLNFGEGTVSIFPYAKLFIADESGTASEMSMRVASHGYTAMRYASSGGSLASPTALSDGKSIQKFVFMAYDGSAWQDEVEWDIIHRDGLNKFDLSGLSWVNIGSANLTTTGNITADYYFGNGSQLTDTGLWIREATTLRQKTTGDDVKILGGNLNVTGNAYFGDCTLDDFVHMTGNLSVRQNVSVGFNLSVEGHYLGNGSLLTDINASTWADNLYNSSQAGIWQRIGTTLSPVTSGDSVLSTGKSTWGSTHQAILGDDSLSRAGSFTDGTRNVYLTEGTYAGVFTGGTFDFDIISNTYAAWVSDGTTSMYLGDGTYIIDITTGDIRTAGSIYDSSDALSIDIPNRFLYAGDGSDPILNWDAVGIADFGNTNLTTTGNVTASGHGNSFGGTNFTEKVRFRQENTASAPTISFGDGDTGIIEDVDDRLAFVIAGTKRWYCGTYGFYMIDNQYVGFGSARDARISFNGADMFIDSADTTANDELHITDFDKVDIVDGNLSLDQLFQLDVSTLPPCDASTNGSIGRNHSGVYGCSHTETWEVLF